jgi:hypothetical protein
MIDCANRKQGDHKDLPDGSISEYNILYSSVKLLSETSTVILFPLYSDDFYESSRLVSELLQTRVLSANVYDGDVWYIHLFRNGTELCRCMSNPELVEERAEDWHFNSHILTSEYQVDEKVLLDTLQGYKDDENSKPGTELFHFLGILKYPVDVLDNDSSYESILPERELKRLTETFLTVEHLRKTKRYSPEPIELTGEQLDEMFQDEVETLVAHTKCATCGNKPENQKFHLDLDKIALVLYGDCSECEKCGESFAAFAFGHKMKEVLDFLNR